MWLRFEGRVYRDLPAAALCFHDRLSTTAAHRLASLLLAGHLRRLSPHESCELAYPLVVKASVSKVFCSTSWALLLPVAGLAPEERFTAVSYTHLVYKRQGKTGSLANGTADFQTVFAGDHDVENEECRTLTLGVGENVGPSGINADGEAFVFEMMADQAGNIRIVFDDEKAGFHGIIVTKAVPST